MKRAVSARLVAVPLLLLLAAGADSPLVEFESEGGAGALAPLGGSGFQRFDVILES